MQVFQSRWGYHPCDYATFRLLRKLNGYFERARRRFAAWKRWQRKLPHNRVIRRRIVDARGRKSGSEVVGPRPEPLLCPVFVERVNVVQRGVPAGERVRLLFDDLPAVYRAARTPRSKAQDVTPLPYSAEMLRGLLAQVEEYERAQE